MNTRDIVLLLLSLIVFILFFPETYLHGDAPGYENMTKFYLDRWELPDSVIDRCRINRPLLPWLSALPYLVFPSPLVILGVSSAFSVGSLFVLRRLGEALKLGPDETFYAAFSMLFSKYYFNYGFTLFVYTTGLFFLLLMWLWSLKGRREWKVGLAGFLSMLAIPTSVTGIFLPLFYNGRFKLKRSLKYFGVLFFLLLIFQIHNTFVYGTNYFTVREWKVNEYSPDSIWEGLLFGAENVGFRHGLVPSWLAVLHLPLTLCMLWGLRDKGGDRLWKGFWFTLATSVGLVIFYKEDGLRMFLSWLPFASLYAGKGIGVLVGGLRKKTKWAEPLVIGTVGVSSVILSAKWVWLFG